MNWAEIGVNILISILATVIGILVVLIIERRRRPKLSMIVGGPNYLVEEDILGRPPCTWLRVHIKNRNVAKWLLWFYQGEAALDCIAWITFYRLDGQKLFDREMQGRWAGSIDPPKIEEIQTVKGIGRRIVEQRNTFDIPAGEGADLDIVIRFKNEDICYGWTDESYIKNWRHDQWPLQHGRYIAKIRVKTGGREFSDGFYIINDVPYQDFRLIKVEKDKLEKLY